MWAMFRTFGRVMAYDYTYQRSLAPAVDVPTTSMVELNSYAAHHDPKTLHGTQVIRFSASIALWVLCLVW